MDIFKWFKTAAAPVDINVSTQAQFVRNVNRLVNLYMAQRQEDRRESIVEEIALRKAVCAQFGHNIPESLEQAVELQTKVNNGN